MGDEIPQFGHSFYRIKDFLIEPVFPSEIVAGRVVAHGPEFRDIGRVVFFRAQKALGQ